MRVDMSEAPTGVVNLETTNNIEIVEPVVATSKLPENSAQNETEKNQDSFNLIKSLGAFTEKFPRIGMSESMEKVSYKLQMDTAILMEKQIAKGQAKAKIPEGVIFRENPNRKEPIDIIRKGLEIFEEKNPNTKIIFNLPEKRTSEIDFVHIVGKDINRSGVLPEKNDLSAVLQRSFNSNDPTHVISYETTKVVADANGRSFGEVSELSRPLYKYFQETKFITQEELFAKALEFSGGKVYEAINMVAETTKAAIRPYESDRGQLSKDEWSDGLRKKMPDEFSDFLPFEDLPVKEIINKDKEGFDRTSFDYSLTNRLGEIYHFWEILKLTQHFTPEMVRTMTMGEYILHLDQQGHIKLLSDLRITADLYEIEDLFIKESLRSSF
jgi:hypothetical protein